MGFVTACATSAGPSLPPPPVNPPASYAEGVTAPELESLVQAYWAFQLESFPEWATQLGDPRYNDRLTDVSWEAVERRTAIWQAFLDRARDMDPANLDPEDRVTRRMLIAELTGQIERKVCRFAMWALSPRSNPITELNYLPQAVTVSDANAVQDLLARYEAGAVQVDQQIANLELGVRNGWFANRESTRRVLAMVDEQLEKPVTAWPMWIDRPEGMTEVEWAPWTERMQIVLQNQVRPALVRYRDLLQDEILPNARTEDVGLTGLPFGSECYAARIQHFTTLEKTAAELHATGHAEIARINREMAEIGRRLFGTETLEATLKRLRNDPSLRFDTATAVMAKAQAALQRARSVLPAWFGRLPEARCVVREIPAYEAPFTTVAYYRQPVPDGSRPGEYYVNTYQPETRTRYEAEALAYHESIPGHHLQIAIQQELSGVPDFRKHAGMTAFVEGWALYAERLADEMGLYSGPLDRLGMLSYEAWRAARLVVDTGLHDLGWSREEAKAYMYAHTALAANNIDNEVDRYIVWPGQALAYKTGQMEIAALRQRARKALGDRFSIEAFHDAVLLGGAVSLPILRDRIDAYIEANQTEAAQARR
ncbi:MAG TPA: DUF885 domain-containing protein [Myxococcales bacterium LLY-WYZ-16_1]|nr:DUF885 domain-containing protein [Myxococcales bacterium LLY-WYZ-16_1]